MGHPDEDEWRQDDAMTNWFEGELRQQSRGPVFAYLAMYGDAIQERVSECREDAYRLRKAGFHGAALVRTAAAIEITVRFFLVRPLILSAFLSEEWAQVLTGRILSGHSAKDRELLPGVLRNWGFEINDIRLGDGSQLWGTVISRIWPIRNRYVHAGGQGTSDDVAVALESLELLLDRVVAPIADSLGFTRSETHKWSVVLSSHDRELNPPRQFDTASPFDASSNAEFFT